MNIGGSVFVVTGAGSGLGAATARMVAKADGRVVIVDLNESHGQAVADELGSAAIFVKADVADAAGGEAVVSAALERFGAVHGLVNCAGIAPGERVLGREGPHALATFQRAVAINLTGTFNMVRLAAAAMARNEPNSDKERGVIVNTASVAAFDGQIGQVAYAASKGGVAAMTLPLARDLARSGIRVVTIAPGIFETPMLRGLPQEVQDSIGAATPFPSRLGRPAEYAALVRHIAENAMLNGEVIRLDGAIRLAPK